LPELAADLVRRRVNVIVTTSTPASLAAKAATTELLSSSASEMIRRWVWSPASTGRVATQRCQFFLGELAAKRLGVLRELAPTAARIAVLVS
jgi:putative ABC transport system substrate-binding protein